MDITRSSNYIEAPSFLLSHGQPTLENPFPDPLYKLNLKETSDFVKSSFPMANHSMSTDSRGFLDVVSTDQRRREGVSSVTKMNSEPPPTPGRPIFSFSSSSITGNLSRKCFPSKWDDAEKWLNGSSSCHDSPAHHHGLKPLEASKVSKHCEGFKPQSEAFAEKSSVTGEKVTKSVKGSIALDNHNSERVFNGVSASADVLLEDKFTKVVEPIFPNLICSEPMREGFLFPHLGGNSMKDAATEIVHDEVKHRDVGTEMTPLGSSTTSRCHTPLKSTSPARHNTPENRSGPLALTSSNNTNVAQLQECHLAKLQTGAQFDSVFSTWISKEEEEEDVSKSLRHFEIGNECRRSVSEKRVCSSWEDDEKNKCCIRYRSEEAKIQAWVNLQSAKAEAQSRKLEVKIAKMRSDLEEKLMKRMSVVHRKADEWRASAQLQHSEQIHKLTKQGQKLLMNSKNSHLSDRITSCGFFPCNNHHLYKI